MNYKLPTELRVLGIIWVVLAIGFVTVIITYAVRESQIPQTKTECLENGSSVMEFGNNALCSLNNDGEYYSVENR